MTSNIDKNSINAQVQYKMIEKLSLMNERLKKEVLVRKKAERESNYARIRLEAIIENLNSGILVEDENRRITTANQGFCDLFSMPIKYEDLIGLDCSNLAEEFKHLVIDSNKFINKITKINKD